MDESDKIQKDKDMENVKQFKIHKCLIFTLVSCRTANNYTCKPLLTTINIFVIITNNHFSLPFMTLDGLHNVLCSYDSSLFILLYIIYCHSTAYILYYNHHYILL